MKRNLMLVATLALTSLQSFAVTPAPPKYWTKKVIVETSVVTLFHMADAAQTCWNEQNTPRWHEHGFMTPRNTCAGASLEIVSSGPAFQWLAHKAFGHPRRMKALHIFEHAVPIAEATTSVIAIRESNK
jgi:hypothetical protein